VLLLGLMSGTSLDAVDASLLEISLTENRSLGHIGLPIPAGLREQLQDLQSTGPNELHRAALAANDLARLYSKTCSALLEQLDLPASSVTAIGAHGQTVRHAPQDGYTLQLLNGALLAELTQIDVICDLRAADVAAGGQGAPLVPGFHQRVFGQTRRSVAVLNLGGIANLTILQPGHAPLGCDTGPASTLLDGWIGRCLGQAMDRSGTWAASGQCIPALLEAMLADPYFAASAPKSTGRDYFNLAWVEKIASNTVSGGLPALAPQDVQATLLELTAQSIALALKASTQSLSQRPASLVMCGGGIYNSALVTRLGGLCSPIKLQSSQEFGIDPQAVESAAFAWLAWCRIHDQPGALTSVTGARHATIGGPWHRRPAAYRGD
jgi:anhydro-N-acetylmuramic acid kinase